MISNAMIVDGDKLTRWSLSEVFSSEGFFVITAGDIATAIVRLKEMRFELIVVEFEINGGDCIPLCDKIQEVQPAAALVVLTSLPVEKVFERLANRPRLTVLGKPYDSGRLRKLARDTLAAGADRGEKA